MKSLTVRELEKIRIDKLSKSKLYRLHHRTARLLSQVAKEAENALHCIEPGDFEDNPDEALCNADALANELEKCLAISGVLDNIEEQLHGIKDG